MTWSRIESDSFFAMSIMYQKLFMTISVNLGKPNKQELPPNHDYKNNLSEHSNNGKTNNHLPT